MHRRRRPGRPGGRGVRGVGGPEHGHRRARGTRRQAGQSAAIENYLGFPKGLTGADLTQRAVAQAARFGAEMVLARERRRLETRGPVRAVRFDGASEIEARAVIVATGVSYRRLDGRGLDDLTGRGVYYGANASEASQCRATTSTSSARPTRPDRRRSTSPVRQAGGAGGPGRVAGDTMSQYLVERITSAPNIEVRFRTEVVAAGKATAISRRSPSSIGTGPTEEVADKLAVRLHRRLAAHRLARATWSRRQGLRRHRSRPVPAPR